MRNFLFVILLLTGCSQPHHPRSPAAAVPPTVNDIKSYAVEIGHAIQTQFYDYHKYAGKTCDVRLVFDEKGQVKNLRLEKGDPELCKAAEAAIKKAQLPPPPTAKIHELTKRAVMHFAPEK